MDSLLQIIGYLGYQIFRRHAKRDLLDGVISLNEYRKLVYSLPEEGHLAWHEFLKPPLPPHQHSEEPSQEEIPRSALRTILGVPEPPPNESRFGKKR